MTDEISGLIVSVVSAISASAAAVVAAVTLHYNAKSFDRFRKAEDLRQKAEELSVLEGIYREIAHGLKEYRLLEAESPKVGEEKVHKKKLDVLLSEFYADVSWVCFLIRHGQIKDNTLVNAFKDQIITWGDLFIENMPDKVLDASFADFKFMYIKFKHEKEHKKT